MSVNSGAGIIDNLPQSQRQYQNLKMGSEIPSLASYKDRQPLSSHFVGPAQANHNLVQSDNSMASPVLPSLI